MNENSLLRGSLKNVMLMFSLLLGCKKIFVNGRICSVRVCVCVCPHTCMNERAAAPQHQQQVWTGACTNLCASSGMYVSDATRQQVFVSACLLAGDTVCVCVCVQECQWVCMWRSKRRLFAGMENAKISRCCWTIHLQPSAELKVPSSCVCI